MVERRVFAARLSKAKVGLGLKFEYPVKNIIKNQNTRSK